MLGQPAALPLSPCKSASVWAALGAVPILYTFRTPKPGTATDASVFPATAFSAEPGGRRQRGPVRRWRAPHGSVALSKIWPS